MSIICRNKLNYSAIFILVSACVTNNIFADELFDLPFENLHMLEITSTSYFPEAPLDVASTVTVMSVQNWEKRGARRFSDAVSNLPSIVAHPNFLGQSSIRIRGYALNRENFLPSLVKSVGGVAEDKISIDIGLTFKL